MFILFENKEIAKQVQKEFNGYFMFNKQIKCELIDESSKSRVAKFKVPVKGRTFTPWREIFKKNFNKEKTQEKKIKKLLEQVQKDRKKTQELKELGIDYKFETYEDLIKK